MRPATLATIEWIKTRRRIAFWVSIVLYFGMTVIGPLVLLSAYRRDPGSYQGAPAWPAVVGSLQSIGLLVMIVMITLLTASEKTWRTERQNVIDGLSRTQYFVGKLILVVAVTLLLWTGTVLLGALFETLFRQVGPADGPFLDVRFVRLLISAFVFLLFCGSIALFFGSVASSSGAALAFAFLFLLMQPVIAGEMASSGGLWLQLTQYLPMQVMSALGSVTAHDSARLAAYLETARANELPLMLGAGAARAVALVSSAVLAAGAWWSIRSRDL